MCTQKDANGMSLFVGDVIITGCADEMIMRPMRSNDKTAAFVAGVGGSVDRDRWRDC